MKNILTTNCPHILINLHFLKTRLLKGSRFLIIINFKQLVWSPTEMVKMGKTQESPYKGLRHSGGRCLEHFFVLNPEHTDEWLKNKTNFTMLHGRCLDLLSYHLSEKGKAPGFIKDAFKILSYICTPAQQLIAEAWILPSTSLILLPIPPLQLFRKGDRTTKGSLCGISHAGMAPISFLFHRPDSVCFAESTGPL